MSEWLLLWQLMASIEPMLKCGGCSEPPWQQSQTLDAPPDMENDRSAPVQRLRSLYFETGCFTTAPEEFARTHCIINLSFSPTLLLASSSLASDPGSDPLAKALYLMQSIAPAPATFPSPSSTPDAHSPLAYSLELLLEEALIVDAFLDCFPAQTIWTAPEAPASSQEPRFPRVPRFLQLAINLAIVAYQLPLGSLRSPLSRPLLILLARCAFAMLLRLQREGGRDDLKDHHEELENLGVAFASTDFLPSNQSPNSPASRASASSKLLSPSASTSPPRLTSFSKCGQVQDFVEATVNAATRLLGYVKDKRLLSRVSISALCDASAAAPVSRSVSNTTSRLVDLSQLSHTSIETLYVYENARSLSSLKLVVETPLTFIIQNFPNGPSLTQWLNPHARALSEAPFFNGPVAPHESCGEESIVAIKECADHFYWSSFIKTWKTHRHRFTDLIDKSSAQRLLEVPKLTSGFESSETTTLRLLLMLPLVIKARLTEANTAGPPDSNLRVVGGNDLSTAQNAAWQCLDLLKDVTGFHSLLLLTLSHIIKGFDVPVSEPGVNQHQLEYRQFKMKKDILAVAEELCHKAISDESINQETGGGVIVAASALHSKREARQILLANLCVLLMCKRASADSPNLVPNLIAEMLLGIVDVEFACESLLLELHKRSLKNLATSCLIGSRRLGLVSSRIHTYSRLALTSPHRLFQRAALEVKPEALSSSKSEPIWHHLKALRDGLPPSARPAKGHDRLRMSGDVKLRLTVKSLQTVAWWNRHPFDEVLPKALQKCLQSYGHDSLVAKFIASHILNTKDVEHPQRLLEVLLPFEAAPTASSSTTALSSTVPSSSTPTEILYAERDIGPLYRKFAELLPLASLNCKFPATLVALEAAAVLQPIFARKLLPFLLKMVLEGDLAHVCTETAAILTAILTYEELDQSLRQPDTVEQQIDSVVEGGGAAGGTGRSAFIPQGVRTLQLIVIEAISDIFQWYRICYPTTSSKLIAALDVKAVLACANRLGHQPYSARFLLLLETYYVRSRSKQSRIGGHEAESNGIELWRTAFQRDECGTEASEVTSDADISSWNDVGDWASSLSELARLPASTTSEAGSERLSRLLPLIKSVITRKLLTISTHSTDLPLNLPLNLRLNVNDRQTHGLSVSTQIPPSLPLQTSYRVAQAVNNLLDDRRRLLLRLPMIAHDSMVDFHSADDESFGIDGSGAPAALQRLRLIDQALSLVEEVSQTRRDGVDSVQMHKQLSTGSEGGTRKRVRGEPEANVPTLTSLTSEQPSSSTSAMDVDADQMREWKLFLRHRSPGRVNLTTERLRLDLTAWRSAHRGRIMLTSWLDFHLSRSQSAAFDGVKSSIARALSLGRRKAAISLRPELKLQLNLDAELNAFKSLDFEPFLKKRAETASIGSIRSGSIASDSITGDPMTCDGDYEGDHDSDVGGNPDSTDVVFAYDKIFRKLLDLHLACPNHKDDPWNNVRDLRTHVLPPSLGGPDCFPRVRSKEELLEHLRGTMRKSSHLQPVDSAVTRMADNADMDFDEKDVGSRSERQADRFKWWKCTSLNVNMSTAFQRAGQELAESFRAALGSEAEKSGHLGDRGEWNPGLGSGGGRRSSGKRDLHLFENETFTGSEKWTRATDLDGPLLSNPSTSPRMVGLEACINFVKAAALSVTNAHASLLSLVSLLTLCPHLTLLANAPFPPGSFSPSMSTLTSTSNSKPKPLASSRITAEAAEAADTGEATEAPEAAEAAEAAAIDRLTAARAFGGGKPLRKPKRRMSLDSEAATADTFIQPKPRAAVPAGDCRPAGSHAQSRNLNENQNKNNQNSGKSWPQPLPPIEDVHAHLHALNSKSEHGRGEGRVEDTVMTLYREMADLPSALYYLVVTEAASRTTLPFVGESIFVPITALLTASFPNQMLWVAESLVNSQQPSTASAGRLVVAVSEAISTNAGRQATLSGVASTQQHTHDSPLTRLFAEAFQKQTWCTAFSAYGAKFRPFVKFIINFCADTKVSSDATSVASCYPHVHDILKELHAGSAPDREVPVVPVQDLLKIQQLQSGPPIIHTLADFLHTKAETPISLTQNSRDSTPKASSVVSVSTARHPYDVLYREDVQLLLELFLQRPSSLCEELELSRLPTPVQNPFKSVVDDEGLIAPREAPLIFALDDKMQVIKTKQRPKKIRILGTDGHLYDFLSKNELKGDLRKDARVQQLAHSLKQLAQSLSGRGVGKGLRLVGLEKLETFQVTTLCEVAGLIEWLPGMLPVRPIVYNQWRTIISSSEHERAHKALNKACADFSSFAARERQDADSEAREQNMILLRARPTHRRDLAQSLSKREREREREKEKESIAGAGRGGREQEREMARKTERERERRKEREAAYASVLQTFVTAGLETFPPVLQRFFFDHFGPAPSLYFRARNNYGLSLAAWSALGFFIGLGDRHCENLLINQATGAIVHVDFDCLLGKGLKLTVPEIVPFRLTRNLVSVMSGRNLQSSVFLPVVKHFHHTLTHMWEFLQRNDVYCLAFIDNFLCDPLVEWSGPSPLGGEDASWSSRLERDRSRKCMAIVRAKLEGFVDNTSPFSDCYALLLSQRHYAGTHSSGMYSKMNSIPVPIPIPIGISCSKIPSNSNKDDVNKAFDPERMNLDYDPTLATSAIREVLLKPYEEPGSLSRCRLNAKLQMAVLIRAATCPMNLAQMYLGWMPWM